MHKKDTYSYKGWLVSDCFLKRAIAVYLYAFVAQLILSLVILVIFLIFGVSTLSFLS